MGGIARSMLPPPRTVLACAVSARLPALARVGEIIRRTTQAWGGLRAVRILGRSHAELRRCSRVAAIRDLLSKLLLLNSISAAMRSDPRRYCAIQLRRWCDRQRSLRGTCVWRPTAQDRTAADRLHRSYCPTHAARRPSGMRWLAACFRVVSPAPRVQAVPAPIKRMRVLGRRNWRSTG